MLYPLFPEFGVIKDPAFLQAYSDPYPVKAPEALPVKSTPNAIECELAPLVLPITTVL